jgi:hypothetical protein
MQTQFPFEWGRECRSKRMDNIVIILERQPFLTITQIGRRLGLKKTPYLREMMIELVVQERVVYEWREMTNGLRVMVFRVFQHEEFEQVEPETDNDGYLLVVRPEKFPELTGESGFPSIYVEPEDLEPTPEDFKRFGPDERDPFWTSGDGSAPTGL